MSGGDIFVNRIIGGAGTGSEGERGLANAGRSPSA